MIDDVNTASIFENDIDLLTVITALVITVSNGAPFGDQLNGVDVMQSNKAFRLLAHEVQAWTSTAFPEISCVLVEHDGPVHHIEQATSSNTKNHPGDAHYSQHECICISVNRLDDPSNQRNNSDQHEQTTKQRGAQ